MLLREASTGLARILGRPGVGSWALDPEALKLKLIPKVRNGQVPSLGRPTKKRASDM